MDINSKFILFAVIAFFIFVCAYSNLTRTLSPEGLPIGTDPDRAFHLDKMQNNPLGLDYPPLLHVLAWPFGASTDPQAMNVFICLLLLLYIPIGLYYVAYEYTKKREIAIFSVIFYLLGTGITSNYLYSSIWPQALAQVLFLGMLYFILKKRIFSAAFFLLLIAFTHKFFVIYGLAIFLIFLHLRSKEFLYAPVFYCMQNGKFTQNIFCLIDALLITVPFIWIFFAIPSLVWKTINDKIMLAATFLPLFAIFLDIRTVLAFGTLLSIYVAKTFVNTKKVYQAIAIIILIVFSIFTYAYTWNLFS